MSNVLHGPSGSDKIEADRGTSRHTLYLVILKDRPLACKMLNFEQLQCSSGIDICEYHDVSMN